MATIPKYGPYVSLSFGEVDDNPVRIKSQVCRLCDLSPELYDEAHYDLAEAWFEYHDYLEYTARILMLSPTYHRWWNQQLLLIENEFLHKYTYTDIPAPDKRNILFMNIVTRGIHPSSELLRRMHSEGRAKIKANPDLLNLKIYRNAKPLK